MVLLLSVEFPGRAGRCAAERAESGEPGAPRIDRVRAGPLAALEVLAGGCDGRRVDAAEVVGEGEGGFWRDGEDD